jgi:hypothetical protein
MRCEICGCDPCETPGFCTEAIKGDERRRKANGIGFDDFLAYAPEHKYIFRPTGERWPAASVNGRLPHIGGIKPSTWLDRNQAVEQMTWAPGEPTLVKDKLVAEGGWVPRHGTSVFNLYRPPHLELGNAANADPWIEHVHHVYPDEADHIIRWFAYRCQHPEIKINHALVLGGAPGIGKDTLLAPVRIAVGHWNVQNVAPIELLGNFTGFRKAVILTISEARDLGDVNRPQFYEHLKTTIAAPPEVLRVNEKHTQEYYVPNVVGVIITTNYKAGGIYLAAEDRRHFVCWSQLELDSFPRNYWDRLWNWFDAGGYSDVAAYLMQLDLAAFNPKEPPPKTEAFYQIVSASQAPENAELANVLMSMGLPVIVVLEQLWGLDADADFSKHLRDRRNRRMISRWMEQCGYDVIRNPDAKDGLWRVGGKKQLVYYRRGTPIKTVHQEIQKKTYT